MGSLQIEVGKDEYLLVNGALLKSEMRARLYVIGDARILRGKMVLDPDQAVTPVQKLYLFLQRVYMAEDSVRVSMLTSLATIVEPVRDTIDPIVLETILANVRLGRWYPALKELLRAM